MSYYKCKNINVDLKKEIVKVEVAPNNISPIDWNKYEYVGETMLEKISKLCYDLVTNELQFQPSVCKKPRLAFLMAKELVDIGQYPYDKNKIIELAKEFIKILGELNKDKTLSKKGYIKYNNVYVENVRDSTVKTSIFATKEYTKLYFLILEKRFPGTNLSFKEI